MRRCIYGTLRESRGRQKSSKERRGQEGDEGVRHTEVGRKRERQKEKSLGKQAGERTWELQRGSCGQA